MIYRFKINRKKFQNAEKITINLLLLILSLTAMILPLVFRGNISEYAKYGYVGVFMFNLLANATVLLPLPGAVGTIIGGAVWNPVWVGISAGLGSALGDLISYYLGYSSREVGRIFFRKKKNWLKIIEKYFYKKPFLTVFILAAVPMPVFDLVGILSGVLNFPVVRFFTATLLGRTIRNILLAVSGAYFF